MSKKKEVNKKSNSIFLLIIATITLVVVVVGASFSYLANRIDKNAISNMSIETKGGNDIVSIDTGKNISINIKSRDEFPINGPSVSDYANAKFYLLTTNSNLVTYKYDINLDIYHNNFEYTSGKCYSNGNLINANDKAECIKLNGTWNKENIPELVIDVYKNNLELNSSNCTNNGVCVDNNRNIINMNENNCNNSGYTYLKNIYEDNKCYQVISSVDITESSSNSKINLLSNETITSQNNIENNNYYKFINTFVNLDHKQNENNNKSFDGKISFEINR